MAESQTQSPGTPRTSDEAAEEVAPACDSPATGDEYLSRGRIIARMTINLPHSQAVNARMLALSRWFVFSSPSRLPIVSEIGSAARKRELWR